jgi:hypothetical protein
MGYRSDVAGIIKFKSIEDREKFVILVKARNDKMAEQNFGDIGFAEWTWDTGEEPYKSDPIMTFEYSDVKWYETFDDVECHYDLCRYAEETFEAEWAVVAVGEDGQESNWTSENYSGDLIGEYIYTVHTLNTNF